MINYKLAKKLKEAGFHQNIGEWEGFWYSRKGEKIEEGQQIVFDKCVYCPTLSELIEACGEDFQWLSKKKKGEWWCIYDDGDEKYGEVKAKSPEEAVAKLWLKLNENT